MWLDIDMRSPVPIYDQIKRGVREEIIKGKLKEGDTLPSIREMASQIRVNPNTVARAYRELEMEGTIMARQGLGYIVVSDGEKVRDSMFDTLSEELKEPILRLKKSGISLDKLLEVIENIWKYQS
ncbi:MAG TPA: GntR family transcriptional regulator [Mesotoga infera]|uniref:HTH-type transcriptional repressor YtrA n=1 Tax=Mesotoga infera TaxID=1236046 RepID=A0A7Z7LDV5_9BACT|nr:GntR family transcriptional regulator [Mesotoga infera]MBP8660490.1 GntR family transcriptional regulator [Mesotoga sp.]NLI07438.1 GntR family transcriptional regulator [Thermotogaceae bacterium]SSC12184.1 HTH-type transcriptional repressor YtrA [Mesotoga infera]HNR79726.1 GntR family transcriptional regulator [Mesotoga infera]HNS66317.1 GntR family transcriptional regulator [Mesotoga infera]